MHNGDYRVYGLNIRPIKPGYFIETKVFASTYSEILMKSIETISVDDEESINNALLAYDALSEKAQAQLLSEKELLDALKQKVQEMALCVNLVAIDNAKVNICTLSGQKVQTIQKGRLYIVNGKKTLIIK